MSETMLLLEADGGIIPYAENENSEYVHIEGSTDINTLSPELLTKKGIIVGADSSADGRWFSMPAWFRQRQYTGAIIVSGKINPDQVSAAFQCGFDGVLITQSQCDRYGRAVWASSLTPLVTVGYAPFDSGAVKSIWAARAEKISQPLH